MLEFMASTPGTVGKVTIASEIATVVVYPGAVHVRSKRNGQRLFFRLVEAKQAGLLFAFGKLTIKVNSKMFGALISREDVQGWFLAEAEKILQAQGG